MLRYFVNDELVFELERIRPEGSDCTAPYEVHLQKDFTVGEFIQAVITADTREWGDIHIITGKGLLGDPCCSYRYGKLVSDMPEEFKNRRIAIAEARGGWTAMDYYLWVEKEN